MKRILSARALLVMAFAVLSSPAFAADNTPSNRRSPIVAAVEKTKNSIVTIRIPHAGQKDSVGTGVIVDERGYIITNRHVVGASRTVNVNLYDGSTLQGDVLQADPRYDLAIVRIRTAKTLSFLKLAPVSDLMVGETVIAIGHPFGYSNTVSTGIISALGREITMPTGDVLQGLIQTDASINPGNSGGPLFNINGELIGINVALREGAQGIAFAINAGTVKVFLNKNLSAKHVAGISHGLECDEKLIGETGERLHVMVNQDSQGKLAHGDEILTVADRGISNTFDVERALWDKKPGEDVACKVLREGKEVSVMLTLRADTSVGVGAVVASAPANNRKSTSSTTAVSVSSPGHK